MNTSAQPTVTSNQPLSGNFRTTIWEKRPILALLILLLVIGAAEASSALFIDYYTVALTMPARIFLDVFLLLTVLFPLLYSCVLSPLLRHISERRQAEIALDRSEENSRVLIESLRDLTWELDATLCLSHLGAALGSLLGYQRAEAVGLAAETFLTTASQARYRSVLAEIIAEQQLSGARAIVRIDEFELLRKDGSSVWTEITATAIFSDSHVLERIVGIFRDISDRKQAEQALHQTHTLLQKTIASLNEAVFIVNAHDRRIQEINRCAEKMFGYPREELLGAPTSILHVNNEMYQWFGNEILLAYQEKGCFETDYRMKRKDGTIFPSEHSVTPITAEDGSYQSHVCVVRDISERLRAEKTLAEAFRVLAERKSFVELIINNLQSGIIVTDLQLHITMVNPYVQEVSRLPAEAVVGTSLHEFCPEIAARIDIDSRFNEMSVTIGASELTIGYTLIQMRNADREATGYIINFRDLTEIVKIRNEIKLKERLSAMGEAVARVAHEMRNPLFGMTTVGQILDMELTLTPPHRQLMDSFMKEARRLNHLVQDLLDGTRELRLRKKTVNLCQVINASLQVSNRFLAEKNIAVAFTPADSELVVPADAEKLEQVLVNLIHNAAEASEPGGAMAIVLEQAADAVFVSVSDAGHGIPEKILPHIFDLFFTSKKNGTGMGLSISRNIAEAHGGTLMAENIRGGGAKFTLTLPLHAEEP